MKTLYIYIDESGNFDFTVGGSKYYILTAVITLHPSEGVQEFCDLKHKILSGELFVSLNQFYKEEHVCHGFHATYDKQVVRDEVYKIIQNLQSIKIHSLVVQKNKTNPSIRAEKDFYAKLSKMLLDYINKKYAFDNLCISFNGMPINKLKQAFIKSIKENISLLKIATPYSIYFPSSSSTSMLDVADYCCWAINRKWEGGDDRSYKLIENFLGSKELDVFRAGTTTYY